MNDFLSFLSFLTSLKLSPLTDTLTFVHIKFILFNFNIIIYYLYYTWLLFLFFQDLTAVRCASYLILDQALFLFALCSDLIFIITMQLVLGVFIKTKTKTKTFSCEASLPHANVIDLYRDQFLFPKTEGRVLPHQ